MTFLILDTVATLLRYYYGLSILCSRNSVRFYLDACARATLERDLRKRSHSSISFSRACVRINRGSSNLLRKFETRVYNIISSFFLVCINTHTSTFYINSSIFQGPYFVIDRRNVLTQRQCGFLRVNQTRAIVLTCRVELRPMTRGEGRKGELSFPSATTPSVPHSGEFTRAIKRLLLARLRRANCRLECWLPSFSSGKLCAEMARILPSTWIHE